jgi:3-oxoacyl-[acyl-carrier-protein] synthase II
MALAREVVITGVGVVSPIGVGKQAFWTSLAEGRSGVRLLPHLVGAGAPVAFGAELTDFEPKQFVQPRKSLKVMCREIQMGYAAAAMAMDDARIAKGSVDPDRLGVTLASDICYCDLEDLVEVCRSCMADGGLQVDRWGERFMSDIYPLWLLRYLPNMAACHIAIANDARGPNNTLSVGDASGLLALIEAATMIERGRADVMLAGGTSGRLHLTSILCRGVRHLSRRADDPPAASRPFDALRDGAVNGEGAAVLVLESQRHASVRGADVLARVLGYGMSYEPQSRPTSQPRRAIHRSIVSALRSAGLKPSDIGHVNAHGLSTIEDDPVEAQAIRDCLGDTPVTAPKSLFGNSGAGGGAVETAASVLSFQTSEVPATRNYEHPDPACPVNVIRGQALRVEPRTAIALNQSATGQAAAIVLGAP